MSDPRRYLVVVAALCGGLAIQACGGSQPAEDDWVRFRGPNGLGVSEGQRLPAVWGESSANRRWKTPLPGFGRSSPVVSGQRVYLANARREDGNLHHGVVAVDAESGALLWETTVATRKELKLLNRFGVHSGATPTVVGDRIYAYFGAELAALDLEGNVVWKAVVEPNYENTTRYGAGSSPIVVGDSVILLQDKEWARPDYDVGWVGAFDRATGEQRWRTELEGGCCSYVTPVVRETPQGTELVVALTQKIVAFDAASGESLWEDAQNMNQPVASPVLDDDLLCVASGGHNVRETVCRRLEGFGTETRVEPLWRTHKAVAETASPLLYRGKLYVLVQKGVLTAYDALTGSKLWQERLEPGSYLASLVAGDGKIFAYNNAGVTSVISDAEGFELLAVNDLGERGSIATPAISGGRLYLRTSDNLICIEPEAAEGA